MDGTTNDNFAAADVAVAQEQEVAPYSLDIGRIMHAIPHRYPFLLIDRMEEGDAPSIGDRREERDRERAFLRRPFPQPPRHCPAC